MIRTTDDVTKATLKVMQQTTDPRLREIMLSLVSHLHGFVRDTKLTEVEFRAATALLNDIGKATTDTHNEAVLMAGSLGVSALVCLLNNTDATEPETSQNTLGPFWRMNSPMVENGGTILRSETEGLPMFVTFRFQDASGAPIAGAKADIWHASPVGLYENQDKDQADYNLRGTFTSDADGRIWFRTIRPSGYPIPTDTVVGRLLDAQNRHPYRPAHVHVLAYKEGFKTLITQIYADDDEHLDSDVQFGVTQALTSPYKRHTSPHPDHPDLTDWVSLDHVLTMQEGVMSLPRAPIK